jgi:hypothetical protein
LGEQPTSGDRETYVRIFDFTINNHLFTIATYQHGILTTYASFQNLWINVIVSNRLAHKGHFKDAYVWCFTLIRKLPKQVSPQLKLFCMGFSTTWGKYINSFWNHTSQRTSTGSDWDTNPSTANW